MYVEAEQGRMPRDRRGNGRHQIIAPNVRVRSEDTDRDLAGHSEGPCAKHPPGITSEAGHGLHKDRGSRVRLGQKGKGREERG